MAEPETSLCSPTEAATALCSLGFCSPPGTVGTVDPYFVLVLTFRISPLLMENTNLCLLDIGLVSVSSPQQNSVVIIS